jgi:hypothetical protein
MKEIFKDYPIDKRYKVSNFGNVKGVNGSILKKRISSSGYYRIWGGNGGRKATTIHQLVAETFLSYERDGTNKTVVDHINGDKLDNNLTNLRIISNRENLSRRGGTSEYVGVSWVKSAKKWRTDVYLGDRYYYLGLYQTEEEAHIAYLDALYEYELTK